MPVLVDGDNLLGTWPGRSRADGEKRDLALAVARLARARGQRVMLVFDGTAPYPLGTDVVFSGPGRRADDVILETLRAATDPRGFTVVTNDKALADQSRWLGARVERCETFRPRLAASGGDEKPGGVEDEAYWKSVFGVDEDERGR